MSEEVNVKDSKSLLVANQFVCNYILSCVSIKHMTRFVARLSRDIAS